MKQEITVGVVCLARKTFDFLAAQEIYDKLMVDLKKTEDTNFKFIPKLIVEIDEADSALIKLRKENIDGLIIINGTFALGHLALILGRGLNCPILLWGLEELPYDGGKIRLNSICGVNLNASNLFKAGISNYHLTIGKIDEYYRQF